MDSRNLILGALLATLFVSVQSRTNPINDVPAPLQETIDNLCRKPASGGYESCLTVFKQNPNVPSATDIQSLAMIALDAVGDQSSSIVSFLAQAIKAHPEAATPLGICASKFDDTKKQLLMSYEDLAEGQPSWDFHSTLDSVETCKSALEDANVDITELSDMINKWEMLFHPAYVAILLAVTD